LGGKNQKGLQGYHGQNIRTIPTQVRGEMANKRKSKEREGWIAVAERLSAKSVRRSKKTEFGVRHQEAVESGESRRLGRVGSVGENLLDVYLYETKPQNSNDEKEQ